MTVNLLLVTATLFAASVAAGLDLTIEDGRRQFLVLAWAIILSLLVNMLMLRRRFSPLERLIDELEAFDPARPTELGLARGYRPVEEIERLAAAFGRLIERLDRERRRGGRLVLRAQEEERRRLARDLHDEVNQALTAILLRLEALSQSAPAELGGELREVKVLAGQAMEELIGLARQLRPAALDDHGLVAAVDGQVRRFAEQTGMAAELATSGDPERISGDGQLVVYRVAQEALSNAGRHSGAGRVEVDLREEGDGVVLRVRDDGRGFDPTAANGGLGLDGMAERARLVGGALRVESAGGAGTSVTLRVS
ncbi:MAG: sensor histidine kinase [Actinomycetota bacterium]|nr:sensor histidine kinase [Actinomycetota bacterium]